jgi:hypothetical protein
MSGDETHIIGRTGDAAIPIAHAFTKIYSSVPAWRQGAESTRCSLTITEIFAYGYRLQEVDPGLTARIQISGLGIESLGNAKIIE